MPAAAAAGGPGSAGSAGAGSGGGKLLHMATRTYREFIWSLAFGLVTVASAPLIAVAMLALGAYKTASDSLRTHFSKKAIGS